MEKHALEIMITKYLEVEKFLSTKERAQKLYEFSKESFENFLLVLDTLHEVRTDKTYEEGYAAGYEDVSDEVKSIAYDEGFEDGKEEAAEEIHDEAYDEGYEDGKEDGYDEGYSDGHDEGLEEGKTSRE